MKLPGYEWMKENPPTEDEATLALNHATAGKLRRSIPVQTDDDDVVLERMLMDWKRLRALASEEDAGARAPSTDFCGKRCDHGSECLLYADHQPPDRHETQHGCIFYDAEIVLPKTCGAPVGGERAEVYRLALERIAEVTRRPGPFDPELAAGIARDSLNGSPPPTLPAPAPSTETPKDAQAPGESGHHASRTAEPERDWCRCGHTEASHGDWDGRCFAGVPDQCPCKSFRAARRSSREGGTP